MSENIVYGFQGEVVSNWKAVKTYLSNTSPKEVVSVLGIWGNLGHYLWNELGGIQYLSDNGILNKINKFLIGWYSALNVADIFPDEVSQDQLIKFSDPRNLSKIILENNYFAVRITDILIQEKLARAISQSAVKKSSLDFLNEIETAKQSFPLIWINLRSHNKSWISQIEGYANIINHLYQDYPNLAVVFDGFVSEKTTMDKIVALIPSSIKTYNALDCPIYESIVWANAIDTYIAIIGSGLTLVTWIANKPGVAHSNIPHSGQAGWWHNVRENAIPPVAIPGHYIIDLDESHEGYCNYDLDWKIIYEELLKIIKNLKNERGSIA
ncbi:MAG: hypothetical protein ACM37W_22345 [Actinomycetota bacterium]